jgi:hypothetical protein
VAAAAAAAGAGAGAGAGEGAKSGFGSSVWTTGRAKWGSNILLNIGNINDVRNPYRLQTLQVAKPG